MPHVAGALGLGFILFAGARFAVDGRSETPTLDLVAKVLMIPAAFAIGVAAWTGAGVEASSAALRVGTAISASTTKPPLQ